MEEVETEERDALCPECGHAFKAFVDRVVPDASEPVENKTVDCPVCGCGQCHIDH